MLEKYLIVFGDNAEQQLKKNLNHIRSYKAAPWLYQGLNFIDAELEAGLVDLVFADPQFIPSAIIDNGKWLSPALFAHNPQIWREAVGQCFAMGTRSHVHCFSYT